MFNNSPLECVAIFSKVSGDHELSYDKPILNQDKLDKSKITILKVF